MAERSAFWTTNNTGDGPSAGFGADRTQEAYKYLFNVDASTGYVAEVVGLNTLAVTGGSGNVSVASGAALVNGVFYVNDASKSVSISTPGSATRIDRIVLRYSSAAQTVRAVQLAGTEGGGAPTLTQNSTTYEVSLARISTTTGGVITIQADERAFLKSSGLRGATDNSTLEWDTTNRVLRVKDGGVTAAKLAANAAVQMGTGVGQSTSDIVKIGYKSSGVNLGLTVNATDWGNIITDGAYGAQLPTAKIANDAVTTAKILNGNVTGAKLSSTAVVDSLGYPVIERTGIYHVQIGYRSGINLGVSINGGDWGNIITDGPYGSGLPTSKLTGTISNAQLASGIDGAKLSTGSVAAAALAANAAVQMGTGIAQSNTDIVKIGYKSSTTNLGLTINNGDWGNIITDGPYGASLPTSKLTGTLSNAQLANMAQATIKGRAAGAGTGAPTDLTPAQAWAIVGTAAGTLPLDGRQGGSGANWSTAGNSNQTIATTSVQMGSISVPMSGTSGSQPITFPSAFGNVPLVLGTAIAISGTVVTPGVPTASGVTLFCYSPLGSGSYSVTVHWLAIGPT